MSDYRPQTTEGRLRSTIKNKIMAFKFEKSDVWKQSLDYADAAYDIAEGSTGQTDKEQNRFLGISLPSLIEAVACIHLIGKRNYCDTEDEKKQLSRLYKEANHLASRSQAMRTSLAGSVDEPEIDYFAEDCGPTTDRRPPQSSSLWTILPVNKIG